METATCVDVGVVGVGVVVAPQAFQDQLQHIPPPPSHAPPPLAPSQEFSTIFHLPQHQMGVASPGVASSPYTLVVDSDAGRSVLARGSRVSMVPFFFFFNPQSKQPSSKFPGHFLALQ